MSETPRLPTGTVTFLFTDIEGSTSLLAALGHRYQPLLDRHSAILRETFSDHGGVEVNTEGDAFFAVFPSAVDAVAAAVAAQRALAAEPWPDDGVIRVRIGLHTGEGRLGGDDYLGLDVNRAARISAAGHGGQILVSEATRGLAGDALPDGVSLRDLGSHQLKDLPAPEHIWQLAIEGLASEFPTLRTSATGKLHVPAEVSSFVGRAEVEAVAGRLETARIVTLTGPGGTGKTRLSMRVAGEIADRFADGVYFVELDAVTDPALVASEIASTLALTAGPESPLDRVIRHLRERDVLLVLDNLEQVVDAATDIARIVKECPKVRVLGTSRIPLRLQGEHEFPVPALSAPSAADASDPERLLQFEAVRLFLERATAARPDFQLDTENAPLVAEIVRRLDGLPLAIELAAARLRTLSVHALRGRLDSALGVLTGGARDAPERQRTLRAALDWSHELLDEPDRRLFARFAVMSGGASLDEAEHVCGPTEELGRDVFDGLDSLSGQSLLYFEPGRNEQPRCAMLATIREYAAERLEATAEAPVMRERHARAYVALAERAAPHLVGPEGSRWNDRLEADHDNLRAALDWIVERGQAELGLRMVAALWRFWQVRGLLHEGERRVHAVLALPDIAGQPAALQARAESAAGGIAWWRSDFAGTHQHYSSALELARQTDDRALLAEALYNAGFVPDPDEHDSLRRYTLGRPLFEEGLALYQELGDKGGVASCKWALAFARLGEGDNAGALELAQESLALSRDLGDPFRSGWATHLVGMCNLALDRTDAAAAAFAESLGIWVDMGDTSGVVLLVASIATIAKKRGREGPHWRLIGATFHLRDETGTDLVNQDIELLGWQTDIEPETDEQRAWLEEGRALRQEEAIALARAEAATTG